MQARSSHAGWSSALLCLLLLAGCASGPRITAEADPNADFSRYRSFGFYAPLAMEKDGYATPTSDSIKAAVRRQMEARGHVYQPQNPDLWVNLNAYVKERTDVYTTPTVDYNYYYRYRGRGGYVVAPTWHDETTVYQYSEGTLNVDVIDAARNTLVWEGIAVGRLSEMKPEQRNAKIDSAVAEMFAQYPLPTVGAP